MKLQFVTTKALFCQDGKVFMLKDRTGNWELPGGRIDFGEQPKEALKREIGEELDINDAKIGDFIDAWSLISANKKFDGENQSHFIVLIYQCQADLSEIKISDEHQDWKWLSKEEIKNSPMREGYRKTLLTFLERSA